MNNSAESIKITIHETQGCLVVPIEEELSKKAAQQIQKNLLEQVHDKIVKGVVIDLSGVKVIDSILWEVFSQTAKMVKLLGASSVISGLSPGVVASIMEMNLDINDLTTAMNLEDALGLLTQSTEPATDEKNDAESIKDNNAFEEGVEKEADDNGALYQ